MVVFQLFACKAISQSVLSFQMTQNNQQHKADVHYCFTVLLFYCFTYYEHCVDGKNYIDYSFLQGDSNA